MVQADLVADALDAHPGDPFARAVAFETASARDVEPWYHSSLMQDRQSRLFVERERKRLRGEDSGELDGDAGVQMVDLMRNGLFPATRLDPDVFRAFIRTFNLLTAPDAMLTDSTVIARVLEVYQDRDNRPPEEPLGPPRREMLAHLSELAA